jgi:hypothetical protein
MNKVFYYDEDGNRRPTVFCTNCGEKGLYWDNRVDGNTDNYLYDANSGEPHTCHEPDEGNCEDNMLADLLAATPKELLAQVYYPVYKTDDGIQLYARKRIAICVCDGSAHERSHGCP